MRTTRHLCYLWNARMLTAFWLIAKEKLHIWNVELNLTKRSIDLSNDGKYVTFKWQLFSVVFFCPRDPCFVCDLVFLSTLEKLRHSFSNWWISLCKETRIKILKFWNLFNNWPFHRAQWKFLLFVTKSIFFFSKNEFNLLFL